MIQSILRWMEKGSESPAGTVTNTDGVKAIRVGLTLALAEGVITALESVGKVDFGPYKNVVRLVTSVAIDIVRRWATDNTQGA